MNFKCQNCKWFEICNGGCPHTAYLYTGDLFQKDFYCEGRKKLFEHMYTTVRSTLEQYR
ncbi:SPASM domain-containing protein [bacterium]|nr:SPASM domain-containing protein [bacterium]